MKVKSWTDAQSGPCRRAARIGAGRIQEPTTTRQILAPRDRCGCRLLGLRSHLQCPRRRRLLGLSMHPPPGSKSSITESAHCSSRGVGKWPRIEGPEAQERDAAPCRAGRGRRRGPGSEPPWGGEGRPEWRQRGRASAGKGGSGEGFDQVAMSDA
jgi:hypothetical protein